MFIRAGDRLFPRFQKDRIPGQREPASRALTRFHVASGLRYFTEDLSRVIHPLATHTEGPIRIVLACAHQDNGEPRDTKTGLGVPFEWDPQGDTILFSGNNRLWEKSSPKSSCSTARSPVTVTLASGRPLPRSYMDLAVPGLRYLSRDRLFTIFGQIEALKGHLSFSGRSRAGASLFRAETGHSPTK